MWYCPSYRVVLQCCPLLPPPTCNTHVTHVCHMICVLPSLCCGTVPTTNDNSSRCHLLDLTFLIPLALFLFVQAMGSGQAMPGMQDSEVHANKIVERKRGKGDVRIRACTDTCLHTLKDAMMHTHTSRHDFIRKYMQACTRAWLHFKTLRCHELYATNSIRTNDVCDTTNDVCDTSSCVHTLTMISPIMYGVCLLVCMHRGNAAKACREARTPCLWHVAALCRHNHCCGGCDSIWDPGHGNVAIDAADRCTPHTHTRNELVCFLWQPQQETLDKPWRLSYHF